MTASLHCAIVVSAQTSLTLSQWDSKMTQRGPGSPVPAIHHSNSTWAAIFPLPVLYVEGEFTWAGPTPTPGKAG